MFSIFNQEDLDNIGRNINSIIILNDDIVLLNITEKISIITFHKINQRMLDEISNNINIKNIAIHCNLNNLNLNNLNNLNLDNLPIELEYLSIFNLDVKLDNLPNKLKTLEINNINSNIDNLPCSLETLYLDYCVNMKLDNLPVNLKKLVIGGEFKNTLDNLPLNMKFLDIKGILDKSINMLPNLEELSIKLLDEKVEINYLPSSLKKLVINIFVSNYKFDFEKYKLENLEVLQLSGTCLLKINNLPKNLKHLILYSTEGIILEDIPENVKQLYINSRIININDFMDKIPINIEELYLPYNFDKELDNKLDNLKILVFRVGFNNNVNFSELFSNLILLNLGNSFNKNIDNLPDTIEDLNVGKKFNLKINKYPQNLKRISINKFHKYISEIRQYCNNNNIYLIYL
ncbi:FNIP repeat protein [Chlorella virus XW01]|nr:FNIP repeat protein [Chlorella virus XW01]